MPPAPAVRNALAERGFSLAPEGGETPQRFQDRMETGLMLLFRDRGGEEEFNALYEYARDSVLRGVTSRLRGYAGGPDPAELVQDAFVNVFRYARSFRYEHDNSFRSWVQAICRNVVRRHLVERTSSALEDLPDHLQDPADQRSNPERCLVAAEDERRLARAWLLVLLHYHAAWSRLSPRDRLALHLVEVDGLSYARACQRLAVRMSNMKMIVFRARKRIRAHMSRAMGAARGEWRKAG